MKDFYDLFVHELRDMYSAEIQIEKMLPELAKSAYNPKLKDAFRMHLKETQNQITRIQQIAAELNISLKKCECEGITGILKEIRSALRTTYPREVHDALLIGGAQRIEHYEMAVYGVLKAFAKHLQLKDAEKLLSESSKEEGHADKILTKIADGTLFSSGINHKAAKRKVA